MLVDALELLVKALERVLEVHRIHGMHGLLPELLQQLGERLSHQAPAPHHVVLVQLRLRKGERAANHLREFLREEELCQIGDVRQALHY